MKHLTATALMLAAMIMVVGCSGTGQDKDTPLTELEPGQQTASYALGMDLANQVAQMPNKPDAATMLQGLKDHFGEVAKVDENTVREVMQSMSRPVPEDEEFSDPNFSTREERDGYCTGVAMAGFAEGLFGGEIDVKALLQGMSDQLDEEKVTLIAETETGPAIQEYQQSMHEVKAVENKKAGEDFLAENAKRPEVTVTESGLQYEVIEKGDGEHPTATDKVKVHYHGTLIDGTVFDSSVERGEPISFPLNRVISGWTEGVQLMPVGAKYKFFIPSELAYGERGAGGKIGPNAALIFDVELIEIEK